MRDFKTHFKLPGDKSFKDELLCPFFSLQEITHFLSVASCDSLPLTRLEGLKELTRQLHLNKEQIRDLLKECHGIVLSIFLSGQSVAQFKTEMWDDISETLTEPPHFLQM